MITTWSFELNSVVRSRHDRVKSDPVVGYVVAREWYEGLGGGGEWYYVRWMDHTGAIESDVVRLHAMELKAEAGQ